MPEVVTRHAMMDVLYRTLSGKRLTKDRTVCTCNAVQTYRIAWRTLVFLPERFAAAAAFSNTHFNALATSPDPADIWVSLRATKAFLNICVTPLWAAVPQVQLSRCKAWQRTGCRCRRSRDLSLLILRARLAESLPGCLATFISEKGLELQPIDCRH